MVGSGIRSTETLVCDNVLYLTYILMVNIKINAL
jgi:hypothetical protein